MSEVASLQKKVSELMDTESRLQRELDELKLERDRRVTEGQRNSEKDRETLRLKI